MEKYGNYYSDGIAELYDLLPLYADRGDAQFYVNYAAASPGPVLELGCGTGRVSIPSAKQGAEILGIDYSASMLRRLRSKLRMESSGVQNRVKVIRGDITQFSLQKKFPLITAPFRSFQHLITQEEQVACLRCAREHLTEGGRIVLDVFQPSPERLFTPSYGPEVDVPEVESAGRKEIDANV